MLHKARYVKKNGVGKGRRCRQKKKKKKKGYDLTDIFLTITKIKPDLYAIMIHHSANFDEINAPLQKLLSYLYLVFYPNNKN